MLSPEQYEKLQSLVAKAQTEHDQDKLSIIFAEIIACMEESKRRCEPLPTKKLPSMDQQSEVA